MLKIRYLGNCGTMIYIGLLSFQKHKRMRMSEHVLFILSVNEVYQKSLIVSVIFLEQIVTFSNCLPYYLMDYYVSPSEGDIYMWFFP